MPGALMALIYTCRPIETKGYGKPHVSGSACHIDTHPFMRDDGATVRESCAATPFDARNVEKHKQTDTMSAKVMAARC